MDLAPAAHSTLEKGPHLMQGNLPLELRDVTFSYPSSSKPVLKNINLKVHEGEFLGIVARTGSGKSTLLSLLAGVIPHHFQG